MLFSKNETSLNWDVSLYHPMYLVILTTDYKLQVIKEEDFESVKQFVKQTFVKGTKEKCDKYVEDLGYTGPIWSKS